MIIKESDWKVCEQCGHRKLVGGNVFGCDECEKPINLEDPEHPFLEATVFTLNVEPHDLHFCSWPCALKRLAKTSTDNFITLPYLQFKDAAAGQSARDFFAAANTFALTEGSELK